MGLIISAVEPSNSSSQCSIIEPRRIWRQWAAHESVKPASARPEHPDCRQPRRLRQDRPAGIGFQFQRRPVSLFCTTSQATLVFAVPAVVMVITPEPIGTWLKTISRGTAGRELRMVCPKLTLAKGDRKVGAGLPAIFAAIASVHTASGLE